MIDIGETRKEKRKEKKKRERAAMLYLDDESQCVN